MTFSMGKHKGIVAPIHQTTTNTIWLLKDREVIVSLEFDEDSRCKDPQ